MKKLIVWLTFLIMQLTAPCVSSQMTCDSTLSPVSNPATAYEQRVARCEGFYRSKVSVGNLEVVGLMLGRLDFDLTQTKFLQITSPAVTNQLILIRAVGIPLKTYYRLDAELVPNGSFRWPIHEVLARAKLSGRKIGLSGRLADHPDVYVPLAVDTQYSKDTLLTLRASLDVGKVMWRYAEMDKGACFKLGAWQEVDHPRGFRSGDAIEIQLPNDHFSQLCVEVAAEPRNSGNWLKRLLHVQLGNTS